MSADSGFLRTAARVALVLGAAGSIILMIRAGRDTPTFLLLLMMAWVLSPYAVLAWAGRASERWSAPTRTTLYVLTLATVLASLPIYAELIARPAGSPRAFMFVAVPPASWLLIAIVLPLAARLSRKA